MEKLLRIPRRIVESSSGKGVLQTQWGEAVYSVEEGGFTLGLGGREDVIGQIQPLLVPAEGIAFDVDRRC